MSKCNICYSWEMPERQTTHREIPSREYCLAPFFRMRILEELPFNTEEKLLRVIEEAGRMVLKDHPGATTQQ